eukprot:c43736_g1_i1 orf=72-254(+)
MSRLLLHAQSESNDYGFVKLLGAFETPMEDRNVSDGWCFDSIDCDCNMINKGVYELVPDS